MNVGSVLPAAALAREPAEAGKTKIEDAACQFEALLLGEMLKSMKASGSEGWLGAGDDEAGGLMLELAQEHLAQVLASQGGLGLAKVAVKGLAR